MSLSAESLHRLAAESGFRIEFLERVDRLLEKNKVPSLND